MNPTRGNQDKPWDLRERTVQFSLMEVRPAKSETIELIAIFTSAVRTAKSNRK